MPQGEGLTVAVSNYDVDCSRAKTTRKSKQILKNRIKQLRISRLQVTDSKNQNNDADQKVGKLKQPITFAKFVRARLLVPHLIEQFMDVLIVKLVYQRIYCWASGVKLRERRHELHGDFSLFRWQFFQQCVRLFCFRTV